MHKVSCFAMTLMMLVGCSTSPPLKPSVPAHDVSRQLQERIVINESTKRDVTKLLGEADIRSVYETSSIEEGFSQIPFSDQFKQPFESELFPYETWTYLYAQKSGQKAGNRSIQVMGVSVFAKDVKTVAVIFNRQGRVLGYNIIDHYMK